jgi:hypothetical protein
MKTDTATMLMTRAIGWTLGILMVPFAHVLVRVIHGDSANLYQWED